MKSLELVLLLADPGEGKTCGEMDLRCKHLSQAQLLRYSSQGQNVKVVVVHLLGDEFLMILAYDVVFAAVHQQIAFEGRFPIIGDDAGGEAPVGGLDVAIAVIDADHDLGDVCAGVIDLIHCVPFRP